MATYKAEFLSHYYAGRFGLAMPMRSAGFTFGRRSPRSPRRWPICSRRCRASARSPSWSRAFIRNERFQRSPRKHSAVVRARTNRNIRPDQPLSCFPTPSITTFHPDVAIAATEVFEDAGFRVEVPAADVCCGRPLYDYGFLGMAGRWWTDLLAKLRPYYRAGIPLVVLEPSCWAAFQDELPRPDAQRRRCQAAKEP